MCRGRSMEHHSQTSVRFLSLALIAIILSSAAGSKALAQKGRGNNSIAFQNGWTMSFSEGRRQAQKANKPLMVVIRCEP